MNDKSIRIDKFAIFHRGWIKNNFYVVKSFSVIETIISPAITGENSPLHIASDWTWTGNPWFSEWDNNHYEEKDNS